MRSLFLARGSIPLVALPGHSRAFCFSAAILSQGTTNIVALIELALPVAADESLIATGVDELSLGSLLPLSRFFLTCLAGFRSGFLNGRLFAFRHGLAPSRNDVIGDFSLTEAIDSTIFVRVAGAEA
jgi:hypothetical protein